MVKGALKPEAEDEKEGTSDHSRLLDEARRPTGGGRSHPETEAARASLRAWRQAALYLQEIREARRMNSWMLGFLFAVIFGGIVFMVKRSGKKG